MGIVDAGLDSGAGSGSGIGSEFRSGVGEVAGSKMRGGLGDAAGVDGAGGHEVLVGDAGWLPGDVELVVGGSGVGSLARGAFGEALMGLAGEELPLDATLAAWESFARVLGMDPLEAFDAVLSERFVFAARRTGRGDAGGVDWVVVTRVDEATARRVTQALRASPRGVRDGRPVLVLEGGSYGLDLRASSERGWMWMSIGPARDGGGVGRVVGGLLEYAREHGPGADLMGMRGGGRAGGDGAVIAPGSLARDPGFEPVRAMGRSVGVGGVEADVAGDAISGKASRVFVFARLDDEGGLLVDGGAGDGAGREMREVAGEALTRSRAGDGDPARRRARHDGEGHGDWVSLFLRAKGRTVRVDQLKKSWVLAAIGEGLSSWPSTAFDRLSEDALAAGIVSGAAIRVEGRGLVGFGLPSVFGGGAGGVGIGGVSSVASQLGLPVSRMAWSVRDRGGAIDAGIGIETTGVDGLVAQGDAFMRSALGPLAGGEAEVLRGVEIGAGVGDHSMRVVRTTRGLGMGDAAHADAGAGGDGEDGGVVAWTYRVCPLAAQLDADCPTAWWTVGLSTGIVERMTDTLTAAHLALPQRWVRLQVVRPRALLERLERSGVPLPGVVGLGGLEGMRRVELMEIREAMLPNGMVLGQGVIEVSGE